MKKQDLPKFSFFRAPAMNTLPLKTITIVDAYLYIRGSYAIQQTNYLRNLKDPAEKRGFKSTNFAFATFSGEFSYRSEKNLIQHSGLLCLDFDHIDDTETLAKTLLQDKNLITALLFVSPSGNGIKWIVEMTNFENITHKQYFSAVSNYIKTIHGVEVDKSGADVCRCCFLPHDQNAFINVKYF